MACNMRTAYGVETDRAAADAEVVGDVLERQSEICVQEDDRAERAMAHPSSGFELDRLHDLPELGPDGLGGSAR
jgi:hypothetical protein